MGQLPHSPDFVCQHNTVINTENVVWISFSLSSLILLVSHLRTSPFIISLDLEGFIGSVFTLAYHYKQAWQVVGVGDLVQITHRLPPLPVTQKNGPSLSIHVADESNLIDNLACRTGVIFCVFQGNRGESEAKARRARVACEGRIAKKSRLSPYHCSSRSGVQIWTRLPNWLLWNMWSSNVFPICNTITYSDLNTTDRFALKLFGEFNWKYGPIGLICSL